MISVFIRLSCWLSLTGYLELKSPVAGNDFPRCHSGRIAKARGCFDSGGIGNKYSLSTFQQGESPFTSFPPGELEQALLLGLTTNTGARSWQGGPCCAQLWLVSGRMPLRGVLSTPNICGKVCHNGQACLPWTPSGSGGTWAS